MACRIVGSVIRGSIKLTGRGDTLFIDLPVTAAISARNVGGIASETATGSAMIHAVAHLRINGRWAPTAKVGIRYDWTKLPGIDLLGQRVEFEKLADDRLRPIIADLERSLPNELSKLNLKSQLATAWAQGFTSIPLNKSNPPAWMRLTPQRLGFGGYRISGGRLEMVLAAEAITETFIGDRPISPRVTSLPSPANHIGPKGLRFFIPVLADYQQLAPVIQRALRKLAVKGIVLPGIGAVDAKFGEVTIYATTNNHLAVGVKAKVRRQGSASRATKGQIWLTAVPYNNDNSQVLRTRDIRLAGQTDNGVANMLFDLFGDLGVQQSIQSALTHDFADDYGKLIVDVRRAIGERRQGDFIFSTGIDDVRNGRIVVTGRGLFLPVNVSGYATIAYRPTGRKR